MKTLRLEKPKWLWIMEHNGVSLNDYTKGKHQTRAQIEQQAVPVLE